MSEKKQDQSGYNADEVEAVLNNLYRGNDPVLSAFAVTQRQLKEKRHDIDQLLQQWRMEQIKLNETINKLDIKYLCDLCGTTVIHPRGLYQSIIRTCSVKGVPLMCPDCDILRYKFRNTGTIRAITRRIF